VIDHLTTEYYDEKKSIRYQAFKRMEDNKPPHPTTLLEKLGAYTGKSVEWYKQGLPQFRAWIGGWGDRFDIFHFEAIPNDVDLEDIGYVGIWRGRTSSNTHVLYCVLPSMKHGEIELGGTFEVNKERVRIGWKQEDLDAMVVRGYEIMMQMIAERGEYEEIKNESIG